jgi:hypothetical protein
VRTANARTIVIWTLVALVGAAGWAVLALSRGEEVSAAWMVAAALGSYAIAYRSSSSPSRAALSGFHSLIASSTTPKTIQKETQVRMIGYGSMLMESSVAVMALVAASGMYAAPRSPRSARRRT